MMRRRAFDKLQNNVVVAADAASIPMNLGQSMQLQSRNPVSDVRLRVAVGGDFCPGPRGAELAAAGRLGEVLSPLAEFLSDADLRMVQFETPIVSDASPIPKTGPNLASAPETVEALRGLFDVALLANNHVGDHGPAAVLRTVRELRSRGFAAVGAGANLDEAAKPLEIVRNGFRVAVFNFAEFEFGVAERDAPGVAPQRPRLDIAAVSRAAADGLIPIVVLHGGHEHFPFPSPRIRDLCRDFAGAGAAMVVNCHTHCPQGVQWCGSVPIIYSPGNLWFPSGGGPAPASRPPLWRFGYVAKVLFDDNGPFALELLPVESSNDEVRRLEGPSRDAFLDYLERVCAPLDDDARLDALFDAWSADRGRFYLSMSAGALPRELFGPRHANSWEVPLGDSRPFLEMRNVFTCESHHDMVRRFLRLAVEDRLPGAMHPCAEIAALQNPEFALPTVPPLRSRAETLDFFERNVFGRVPEAARLVRPRFAEIAPAVPAMGGSAIRRMIRIGYSGPGGEGGFDLLAFIPAGASPSRPVPAALLLCNRDPAENMDPERARRTPFWDAERIVARGWAALAFHVGSVVPDNADGFDGCLQSLFLRPGEGKMPDAWGTLAAWAWCASRAMDWIETEPGIDARRVMVAGHSRGGKTALWCAASDERFAMAVSNCSGCGGAKLNRACLPASESIGSLVNAFPHWFCGNFASFAGMETQQLTFDQNQLLSLVAPRLLYVSSATLDPWAGQPGEWLAAKTASPAWRAAGRVGIPDSAFFPDPDVPVFGDGVAYHIHRGPHTILSSDWDRWIDFAQRGFA